MRLVPALLSALLLFSFTTSLAASVTLEPVKDGTLYEPECEKSNGSGWYFFSGNTDGQGLRRAVLAFDVAGNVPAGVTIESASLQLHVSMSNTGTQTHNLHIVTQDWGEGASDAGDPGGGGDGSADNDVSWCYRFYNKNDPQSSPAWTSLGGDYVGTSSGSAAVGGVHFYTWTSAQMAADVQDWLDNPANNFGWIVLGNEGQNKTAKRFDSREHNTANLRPKLTIVYGEPSTPPDVTVIAPNGGETLTGNTSTLVNWTATDESGIAYVDLYASYDGGTIWEPVALNITTAPPFTWSVANRPTAVGMFRVVATDNTSVSNQDDSDGPFTVQAPVGGRVPTTLRDFDQPGTKPLEVEDTKDPSNCRTCHGDYGEPDVEPYRNWYGSMMAQASIDPLFEACMSIANQDAPDSGDLCLRCHISKGWLGGRSIPTDGSAMLPTDKIGVNCNFCHRLVDPIPDVENPVEDTAILAGLAQVPTVFGTGTFVVDPDAGARRGPFVDAVTGHAVLVSPFHREAALCGTCHDVSNPAFSNDGNGNFVPNAFDTPATDFGAGEIMAVERTYSEWFHSAYNSPGGIFNPAMGGNNPNVGSCQDCHMRDVTGHGCNDPSAPVRTDLPLHDMTGGSTWIPTVLAQIDPTLDQTMLAEGILRARYMLQNAASLDVQKDGHTLNVTVTNETGHKLPTGYPEGRRMWLDVKFFDGSLTLLEESGAYDLVTAVLSHDEALKLYEIEPATDGIPTLPDSTLFHFVLNNTVIKDNRIPPRGFTNAAFDSFGGSPVDYAYPDGQHWDLTAYDIPTGTTRAEVTLYYQSSSKEFIEFLRDENTTDTKGQEMYDLWANNGKCPPEVMATQAIEFGAVAVGDPVPPRRTVLAQNTPNPFNPSTAIHFELARGGRTSLIVYDARGRLVKTIVDEELPFGEYDYAWRGNDNGGNQAASGVYYYVLKTPHVNMNRQMALIR